MITREVHEHHGRTPSALAFMARALVPSPGLGRDGGMPRIGLTWSPVRIHSKHLAAFHRGTGLADEDGISILYPQVLGFPLVMALLTHRSYPLPIWHALQIRNRLVRHRRIDPREVLRLEARIGAHRVVEKGIEVDVATRLSNGQECCWESEITFFYRGRFGTAGAAGPRSAAPALALSTATQRFEIARGGGRAFAKLTGDYNPIHLWPWYARRMRFPDAFSHPQRVAAMCLARLPRPDSDAQSLDLWIKGPVFYGACVTLGSAAADGGTEFGLFLEGDPRPALSGWWGNSSSTPIRSGRRNFA